MRRPEHGFTLVELAITLVIVGLLVSAILGVSRLRQTAALQATVSQMMSYGTATALFVDRHDALPGDLKGAGSKIPGCPDTAACEADPSAATTGDGKIGIPGGIALGQTEQSAPERETQLFWTHLYLSDLIIGITDTAVSGTPPAIAWGQSHPAAPVGGGFHVKDADGGITTALPGWPPGANQPSGTFLVLQSVIDADLFPAPPDQQTLTPLDAAWIDRKLDDGNPLRGHVLGYGTTGSVFTGPGCFDWIALDRSQYDESTEARNCGIAYRLAP